MRMRMRKMEDSRAREDNDDMMVEMKPFCSGGRFSAAYCQISIISFIKLEYWIPLL